MESEGIPSSPVCLTQTASIMISLSHQNGTFVKPELILACYHPEGMVYIRIYYQHYPFHRSREVLFFNRVYSPLRTKESCPCT